MDAKLLILKLFSEKGPLSSTQIATALSISRQAAFRHLAKLVKDGRIVRIGQTRGALYTLNNEKALEELFGRPCVKKRVLINKGLEEDVVLKKVRESTPIFNGLRSNVEHILNYAFTEILNNAIEHSKSPNIHYLIKRSGPFIEFYIKDYGVGVFKNIKEKRLLKSELDAIQELIKGKSTTDPKAHSGEGIFFTSKAADKFSLTSFGLELLFDNIIDDVFVRELRSAKGTNAHFVINLDSTKNLDALFAEYSNESFEFDKSRVSIKLFTGGTEYISRSQARRLLENMDKFKRIVLDFKDINTIGQGFADEVFRVFKEGHPNITIEPINCSKIVLMMIRRASIK